jgi:hypothetical protein
MENGFPTNWQNGFHFPFRIGAGGCETPFLKDGKWHIRLWNAVDRLHYIYCYATDIMEPERP